MTSQPAVPAEPAGMDTSPRFAFDARRWTRYEVITAGLSLVLLPFLSRPWYDVRFVNCPPDSGRCQRSVIGSVDGSVAHGYLWLAVLPVLIIVVILILRAGFGRVPSLIWPADRQVLAGAAGVQLIIVLAAFLTKSGVSSVRVNPPSPFAGLSVTWEAAAWIALALAVTATGAAAFNLTSPRQQGS